MREIIEFRLGVQLRALRDANPTMTEEGSGDADRGACTAVLVEPSGSGWCRAGAD